MMRPLWGIDLQLQFDIRLEGKRGQLVKVEDNITTPPQLSTLSLSLLKAIARVGRHSAHTYMVPLFTVHAYRYGGIPFACIIPRVADLADIFLTPTNIG